MLYKIKMVWEQIPSVNSRIKLSSNQRINLIFQNKIRLEKNKR